MALARQGTLPRSPSAGGAGWEGFAARMVRGCCSIPHSCSAQTLGSIGLTSDPFCLSACRSPVLNTHYSFIHSGGAAGVLAIPDPEPLSSLSRI